MRAFHVPIAAGGGASCSLAMIVPMKKAVIVCLKQERDELIAALQRCGEFMPTSPEGANAEPPGENEAALKCRQGAELLRKLGSYQEKKSMFSGLPEVEEADFVVQRGEAMELSGQIATLFDSVSELQSEQTHLLQRKKQLEPWLSLRLAAEEVGPTAYTETTIGFLPEKQRDSAQAEAERKNAQLSFYGSGSDGVASVLVIWREDAAELLQTVKELGFVETTFPMKTGTPEDELGRLTKRLDELAAELAGQKEQLAKLSERSDELGLLLDQYQAASDRAATPAVETAEAVYLEGWVRVDRVERLKRAIQKVTEIYDLSLLDPQEGEKVPTATKNNRFITQFETITDMFSRPGYGSLDPNPVMGPWYWIIYGMMMGDVGYGVLMIVFILLFKKLKKPRGQMGKLVNVLLYSSATTMVFGVLFGSYFGETWHPLLFAPLENPIGMLVLSLVIGVLHIFSGMILKMVSDFREGRPWDAIFDQLTWMLIIVGAGMLFLEPLQTVGIVLAAVGAVTILLTGGRAKKGFGKVTGGLMGLYGVTGFLSDILSYARIMALGLATGVIGYVMNLLAGMVIGVPLIPITATVSVVGILFALVVYAVGHLFNLAMSLLSAYVHDSRLQYIEFYSKFYEGGGTEFKPLAIRTQYVDLKRSDNK